MFRSPSTSGTSRIRSGVVIRSFDGVPEVPAVESEAELPKRQRSKRGEGDRLREEILDAVDTLLLEHASPDSLSIRAVADRVGCTPPAIYLHFFDKKEMLFDVCARRFRQQSEAINAAVDEVPASDPLGRVEAGMRAYIRFGLDYPEHYRTLFMGRSILSPDELDELRSSGITGIDPLVERCDAAIRAGAVTATDPHLMAFGIWSVAHGLVSLQIAKPHGELPAGELLVDELVRTYVRGLAAERRRPSAA